MNETEDQAPLCPNGCGQRVQPLGRGSHNRICPKLKKAVGGDSAIVAALRDRADKSLAEAQHELGCALGIIEKDDCNVEAVLQYLRSANAALNTFVADRVILEAQG